MDKFHLKMIIRANVFEKQIILELKLRITYLKLSSFGTKFINFSK